MTQINLVNGQLLLKEINVLITWSESLLISQNWTVYKGSCYEQLAPLALSSMWTQCS